MFEILKNNKKSIFLICVFILTLYISCIYLIGAFPGNFTPDSVNQLSQIVGKDYSNAHTPLSTVFYAIPIMLFKNIQSTVIFQQLFFAIVSTYALSVLLNKCKNKIMVVIMWLLFIISPTNNFMLTNMWKDIPYSISVMLLTTLLINIITDKKWLNKKYNMVIFCLSLIMVGLFRHNGIIPMLLTLAALFIFNKKNIQNVCIVILTLFMYLTTNSLVKYMLSVKNTQSKADIISIPLQQIAAVVQANGKLEEQDKYVLEKIAPLEVWSEKYDPYLSDNIKNLVNNYLNNNNEINRKDIIKVYINIAKNNINTVLKAYMKQISILWRLDSYPVGALTYYAIEPNVFNADKEIISKKITSKYLEILDFTKNNKILLLICWNPALIMYIVIIIGIVYLSKVKNYNMLLAFIPMFANIFSLLISIPAQDYRYVYSSLLCGGVIGVYMLDKIFINNNQKMLE